ncbi:hypothetical protein N9U79_00235 [Alphaproteobacteria bacterium]|nr:hypothetical protein [Alphaproteobacteria bacterium]
MEFRNNFQELKSQIEYLSSLNKEDVTHIIKSSIYELESLKVFNEEELIEINKVTLISEPFNNLFFKYNKERLINKGVVYIEEENDLQFIISLFYFFKQRVPILFHTSSKLQLQFIDILNKFLEENDVSKKFLRKIDE